MSLKFQHFSYDLYKTPYKGCHKTVLCECDFRENWLVKVLVIQGRK